MSANEESLNLFLHESEKLKKTIDELTPKINEISMEQIVETYYQVIKVNSLTKVLQSSEYSKELQDKIIDAKKVIEETFNNSFHLSLRNRIENSIEEIKNNLKTIQNNGKQKSKDEIEDQAKMYENLRKLMSTKEFVEQYNKLIDES